MSKLNIRQQFILKKALELYKENLHDSIEASESLLSMEEYNDLKNTFSQSITLCNENLDEIDNLLERLTGEVNDKN